MQQNLFAGKLALNITILRPDKLDYRVLFGMVQTFRGQCGKFPDLIEFTPELLRRFRADLLSESAKQDRFLGIRCIVDPKLAMSHNLSEAKAGE